VQLPVLEALDTRLHCFNEQGLGDSQAPVFLCSHIAKNLFVCRPFLLALPHFFTGITGITNLEDRFPQCRNSLMRSAASAWNILWFSM
jgi:hypothetical protein